MNCIFKSGEKGAECQQCGRKLTANFREPPQAICRVNGLGDSLEELLTSYGITKEWYQGFKEKFGLPPTCNCNSRQEWLNKTSEAHPTIANIGVKILNALKRK